VLPFEQTAAELETRIRFLLHRINNRPANEGGERVTDETVNVRYMVDDVDDAIDDPSGNPIELFQPAH
jgi:hypothetical protein